MSDIATTPRTRPAQLNIISGRGPSAPTSIIALRNLLRMSQVLNLRHRAPSSHLTILPGSGINPESAPQLLYDLLLLGLKEIHLSGGGWLDGGMQYRKNGMGMGVGGSGEWGIWRTSESVVRDVRKAADEAWQKFQT